jgi:SAM-dependent methyltransferase
MDVSPRILARALAPAGGDGRPALGCATDVRHLALRPASFDVVLSPSTLDHFADERDIALSLAQIRETLRPGGHLLVALDNPTNPVLRLREAVYGLAGPIGGVIPFPMGRTLSRAGLVTMLEAVGFEVLDSGYLVHAPRIVGLWLGEWAARWGRHAAAARIERWLGRVDRAFARSPFRRWSAQFVVAHARRPG